MHVWDEFWGKVHYSAVFGDGKRREMGILVMHEKKSRDFNAETQRKDWRKIKGEKT
jgi:hypothetical protein